MTGKVFTSITDSSAATLIKSATKRVVFVSASVREKVTEALMEATARLDNVAVRTVIDCDEEVFRLGYGDIDSVKKLKDSGCTVQQCSGLRVGVLICDDRAWVFAPTALYVQDEVHSAETPNAVELRTNDVERIIWRLSPAEREKADVDSLEPELVEELDSADTEIGIEPIREDTLQMAEENLKVAPPIRFNIARQVRVFTPYIQYVTLQLQGCAIERRRIEIPKSIRGAGSSEEIERRLKTTFELIERNSKVSSKSLEDRLRTIRDDLTRSLGPPWGRVLLRSARKCFDDRIDKFREDLEIHKKIVKKALQEHLEQSRTQVSKYFLPIIKEARPDFIYGQLATHDATDEQIQEIVMDELAKVFPKAKQLVGDMKLEVHYRDVTYETLNEEGFEKVLNNAYPYVNWNKPFEEFNAAKEKEQEGSE